LEDPAGAACAITVYGADGSTSVGGAFMISSDGIAATSLRNLTEMGGESAELSYESKAEKHLVDHVMGYSQTYDLALVKVQGSGFPALGLGFSSEVKEGDPAVVVARPQEDGPVMAVAFDVTALTQSSYGLDWIEVAGQGMRGRGFPLLNGEGEVVGIYSKPEFFTPSSHLVRLIEMGDLSLSLAELSEELRHFQALSPDGVLTMGEIGGIAYEESLSGASKLFGEGFFIQRDAYGESLGLSGTSANIIHDLENGLYYYGGFEADDAGSGSPSKGFGAILDEAAGVVKLGSFSGNGWSISGSFEAGSGYARFSRTVQTFDGTFNNYITYRASSGTYWIYIDEYSIDLEGNQRHDYSYQLDGASGACWRAEAGAELQMIPIGQTSRFFLGSGEDGAELAIYDSRTGFSFRRLSGGGTTFQMGSFFASFSGDAFTAEISSANPSLPEIKARGNGEFYFVHAGSPSCTGVISSQSMAVTDGETGISALFSAETGSMYIGRMADGAYEGEGAFFNGISRILSLGSFSGNMSNGTMALFGAEGHPLHAVYERGVLKVLMDNAGLTP
jgi:hypothetical protein